MKKCGAKPIVDTYVQLAHALNTLQSREKHGSTPKATNILEIIDRLTSSDLQEWQQHKGIGVLLTVLKSSVLHHIDNPNTLVKLIEASKLVWEKSSPMGTLSKMSEEEKEKALTHYIFILSFSELESDWVHGYELVPLLLKKPSNEGRLAALRIAQKANNPDWAKEYWKLFGTVPFDWKASQLMLYILRNSSKHYFLASKILDEIITNYPSSSENKLPSKLYMMAIQSCFQMGRISEARSIFNKSKKDERIQFILSIRKALLDVYLRATEIRTDIHPDEIYLVIRELQVPTMLNKENDSLKEKLEFLHGVQKLVKWRLNTEPITKEIKEIVKEDLDFYKRWEDILRGKESLKRSENEMTTNELTRRIGERQEEKLFERRGSMTKRLSTGKRDKI